MYRSRNVPFGAFDRANVGAMWASQLGEAPPGEKPTLCANSPHTIREYFRAPPPRPSVCGAPTSADLVIEGIRAPGAARIKEIKGQSR